MMHDNAALLDRLFTALDKHDHVTMASCYREHAHFRDIAFDLVGRTRIHSMWHMICSGDIRADWRRAEPPLGGGQATRRYNPKKRVLVTTSDR